MSDKIWLLGTVPDPVGGVSVFLSRVIGAMPDKIAGLVDPYFAKEKLPLPVPHIRAKCSGLAGKIRVLNQLRSLHKLPLLINGSRPESAMALSPFLLSRRSRTGLILHHGDLEKSLRHRPWLRGALRWTLGKYNYIGCLSNLQRSFYVSLGVERSRLQLVETYLPPLLDAEIAISSTAQAVLDWLDAGTDPVFIGSGYAYPYYRHDWGLDFLEHSTASRSRYLLCNYGPITSHLSDLQARFSRRADAKLVFGLKPHEFDLILKRCQIYIRPTDVDSYGMAVHDAVNRGLKVVASDACSRPSQCAVHPIGQQSDFFALLNHCLANLHSEFSKSRIIPHQSIEHRISIADFIDQIAAEKPLKELNS